MLTAEQCDVLPVKGLFEGLRGLYPATLLRRHPDGQITLRVTYPDGDHEMDTYPYYFVRRTGRIGAFIAVTPISTDEYTKQRTGTKARA